jgi:hypothetical protein
VARWARWFGGDRAPPPAPPERESGVGRLLRETRLAKGMTIEEVERDTRINRLYIEALEAEHFDALPAPVYARGFMRSYARYLELDADDAVASVPRDLPRPADLEPLPGLRRTSGGAGGLPSVDPRIVLAAIVGITVLVALWFFAASLGGGTGLDIPEPTPGAGESGDRPPLRAPPGGASETGSGGAIEVPPFDVGTTPNFIGVQRDTAVALLEQLGLAPFVAETVSELPAGVVFDQSPAAGDPIEAGDVITLIISTGPSP